MEVRLNGETHFSFSMKEYIINKLPIFLLEICIWVIIELVLYVICSNSGFDMNDYNTFIRSLRMYCWIVIPIFTICICFMDIFDIHIESSLIISKDKWIQLHREKTHRTGTDWYSYWISNEYFYAKNIKGFYEGIFSFVIYGDVEFIKTQRDGSIKKVYNEKLVIKKIFENNAEIRDLLNEITNI